MILLWIYPIGVVGFIALSYFEGHPTIKEGFIWPLFLSKRFSNWYES